MKTILLSQRKISQQKQFHRLYYRNNIVKMQKFHKNTADKQVFERLIAK